jgi:HK97 gp10 family phage protein
VLLDRIPKAIMAAMRTDIENSVAAMVAQMKLACPIDNGANRATRTHTAHVRDTILFYWSDRAAKSPLEMRMMVKAGSREGTTVRNKNGKAFQLAKLIEFGTQHRPATPFFWPVWRASKRKIRRNATDRINAVIKAFAPVSLTDDKGNGAEAA